MIDRLRVTKTITLTYDYFPTGDGVDLENYKIGEIRTTKEDIISILRFTPDENVKIEVKFEGIYDVEE